MLRQAVRLFASAGVQTEHSDARLLLQAASRLDHAALIARSNDPAPAQIVSLFADYVERRIKREPVGRILGEAEFYGRAFGLSEATLEPRADTEILVDLALRAMDDISARIDRDSAVFADIGTGSGAIAITLAAERPNWTGVATDVSEEALSQAKKNAQIHDVTNLSFAQGDGLSALTGTYDLIVSNPPYIASSVVDQLEPEVRAHDPRLALDGGTDGLDFYRHLISGAGDYLEPNGFLILEIGFDQADQIKALLDACENLSFCGLERDLGGNCRVVTATKPLK
jgi:release factor glutamine methyltransferase